MIEELIEEGQYQVALSRLTDMDDEMTRYYRSCMLECIRRLSKMYAGRGRCKNAGQ